MKLKLPADRSKIEVKLEDETAKASITDKKIGPDTMTITGPVILSGSYDLSTREVDSLLLADCDPKQYSGLDVVPEYNEADIIKWMDRHFFVLTVDDCYNTICLETGKPFYFGLHYANTCASLTE